MTLTIQGLGTLACVGAVHIGSKGTLTHDFNTTNSAQHKLNLSCSDITLDAGGKVDVTGRGFTATNGPGGVTYLSGNSTCVGASYGGLGGNGYRDAPGTPNRYGSFTNPVDLGSGGYLANDAGGGAVYIVATGTANINGSILAKGSKSDSTSGGGSGGSIWIQAGTMNGSGSLVADGGGGTTSDASSGGGGGRIALAYTTKGALNLTVTAKGGLGRITERLPELGTLSAPASFFPNDLVVTQATYALAPGSYNFNSLSIQTNGQLELCAGNGVTSTLAVATAITIYTNGALILRGDTNGLYGTGCALIASNVQINAGGSLTAAGKGFRNLGGPGAGWRDGSVYAVGASHGGDGAPAPMASGAYPSPRGRCYGSVTNPTALGSATLGYCGDSDGGGAIRLIVTHTLTVNGVLSADAISAASVGYRGCGGGGSGGSLWITAGRLTGNGLISANGGLGGSYTSGGGGGRIALYAPDRTGFAGQISLVGGAIGGDQSAAGPYDGLDHARAGTLYLPEFATPPGVAWTVTKDMALMPGTNYFTSLLVTNGAILECQGNTNAVGTGSGGTNFGVGGGAAAAQVYNAACSNQPTALGSGGGNNVVSGAGTGGGAIRLNVSGYLYLNGTIRADGQANSSTGAGAGSGGSLWINAAKIKGLGSITASGGAAATTTCGGGGGRIAIYYGYPSANFPAGGIALTATGGTANATSGTIYWQRSIPGNVVLIQ